MIKSSLVWRVLWFVTSLPVPPAWGGSGRRHNNPGHYLRLFDIPELCPHLSFVIPWTTTSADSAPAANLMANDSPAATATTGEVLLFQYQQLSIRQKCRPTADLLSLGCFFIFLFCLVTQKNRINTLRLINNGKMYCA
jgi:hypothetical protein